MSNFIPAGSHDLSLLAVNLTRRCNLKCAHCYQDASTLHRGDNDELDADEVKSLLDDIASMKQGTMVVLTGGEPLLRQDIEQFVRYGTELGLPMVIGTNGMLLTEKRVKSLKDAGLLGLGISLDSLDQDYHDQFRGYQGAWARTMAGIERCRDQQMDFQLHFSVTRRNSHELKPVIEFAQSCGARALNVFFTICVGRARSQVDVDPKEYEALLAELVRAQSDYPGLILRPRCAPHYKRIAYEMNPQAAVNRISGREADGCIAGIHYARVNYNGGVTACPYIEQEVGNIRSSAFSQLWENADDFILLRGARPVGKCGICEFQNLCGGCRARPLANGGQLMGADDLCNYQPRGQTVRPVIPVAGETPRWSAEAEHRLHRVPAFLRSMVKKRTEVYVQELGEKWIYSRHMSALAAARFGSAGPPALNPADKNAGQFGERHE